MAASEVQAPGVLGLVRKLVFTSMRAMHNRGELFLVELQEENNRIIETVIWAAAVCFLGILFFGVFTATVILLFPSEQRVYAAGGFSLLYLIGTFLCAINLKALVKGATPPFQGSIEEVKKDREWLESLK